MVNAHHLDRVVNVVHEVADRHREFGADVREPGAEGHLVFLAQRAHLAEGGNSELRHGVIDGGGLLRRVGLDEAAERHRLHHPAVRGQRAELFVVHVPGDVGERRGARVRGDDRRGRQLGRLQHGVPRDVRDVHQDAETVQLGDHFPAELADPAVFRLRIPEVLPRIAGIGDVVVSVVDEAEVAGAELVVLLEQRQVLADREAVLDPDHRDQLPLGVDPFRVVRAIGDLDDVRMHRSGAVDGVELGHRPLPGRFVVLGRPLALAEIDDEEPHVEAALLHPRVVHLEVLVDVSGVHLVGGVVEGDVNVGVEGHHRVVDAAGFGLDPFLFGHGGGLLRAPAAAGGKSGHHDDERAAGG